ncbi:MAG: hypothetical protein IKA36_00795 [Clostridia bacterium]|nr:hypothetical protein [Clostridia bacterium]
MKKLFFSLILCFILLGTSMSFSACKNDKFKLSQLNTKYEKAVENLENVKITEDGLTFVYNEKFTNEINNNLPYKNIKDFYTPLLNYSTAFINGYIKKCSTNEIETTKKQRKNIEQALNNFTNAIAEVDSNISAVTKLVDIDASSTSAHIKTQNLFLSYENLYKSAFRFSNYLQELYFNYASDYNTNPAENSLSNFDIDKHVVLLNPKIASAKVELTETFIEKYIRDHDYSTKLTEKTAGVFNTFAPEFNEFNNKIKSIDKAINSKVASSIIKENLTKKQDFYNFCIESYNVEMVMKDINPFFKSAKDSISFMTENNNENITTENKMKIDSINRYDLLANDYVESLQKIIILLEI